MAAVLLLAIVWPFKTSPVKFDDSVKTVKPAAKSASPGGGSVATRATNPPQKTYPLESGAKPTGVVPVPESRAENSTKRNSPFASQQPSNAPPPLIGSKEVSVARRDASIDASKIPGRQDNLPLPPAPATSSQIRPEEFDLRVYSRHHQLENGQSFPIDDAELGQLAMGDIQTAVDYNGQRVLKGLLTLEWSLDGLKLGAKPIRVGSLVEYKAEPHVGTYKVVLSLNGVEMRSFVFRITP
jgi:hypothetical protein